VKLLVLLVHCYHISLILVKRPHRLCRQFCLKSNFLGFRKCRRYQDVIIYFFMCLLAHSGFQHILCCVSSFVFLRLVYPMMPVSLDCPFSNIDSSYFESEKRFVTRACENYPFINGQSRETGIIGYTRRRKTKLETQHNMCWKPLCASKHIKK
jgi:hypothetical protein